MPQVSIGVIGIRDHNDGIYSNYEYVCRVFNRIYENHDKDIKIIIGGGKGADQLVIKWCEQHSIPFKIIPPDVKAFGPDRAFVIRNNILVEQSEELVLLWDGVNNLHEIFFRAITSKKVVTVYPPL